MDIETFPEIENFQKLPKQVIVKAGATSFDSKSGARLQGIVINNSGHAIRDIYVNIVVFDEKKIPQANTCLPAEPSSLPQGAIANFSFEFKNHPKAIEDYHLYTNWRIDDQD
ncbi:MAG TPA: hypothetical protein VL688_07455 [Verrucomicrobiae bacterium]|nr:hypothetical protein [Verrucomicrobiae bacterium]